MDVLVTSTSIAGLSPLGTASGRSHLVLTDVLRERLSEDHAALLADPVQTGYGDRFDWYAARSGSVVALQNLSGEDQEKLRELLGRLTSEVAELSDELRESTEPRDVQLGQSLSEAMEVPGESSIYAIRDEHGGLSPVLVNWGFVAGGTDRPVRGVLRGMARAPVAVPIIPAAVPLPPPPALTPQTRNTIWPWLLWLGWLLLALLIAAILWLMILPCALKPGSFLFYCPVSTPVETSSLEADRQVLEDEIAALVREIALADRSCQPTDRDELDALLDERGGEIGDLNFTLFWNSTDDIDLHVTCPAGPEIYYGNRNACNGTLDVDANAGSLLTNPVENVFFINPAPGRYHVIVKLYSNRTSGQKNFTLRVLQRDGRVQEFSGTVSRSVPNWDRTITITD